MRLQLADSVPLRSRPTSPDAAPRASQEVVIDTRSISSNLPAVVLGFFYLEDASEAAEARWAFIDAYGLDEEAVPLMRLDWEGSPRVFSLA